MENANKRILITMVLGIVALVACLIGVVRLAFFQKGKYSGDEELYDIYTQEQFEKLSPEKQQNCVVEEHVNPTRGTIYDDKGRPLVTSVRVYSIGIDGRNFNTKHEYFAENSPYLDTLIHDLAVKFYEQFKDRYDTSTHTVGFYRDKLSQAFKQHKRVQIFYDHEVVVYKKMILDKDIAALESLPVLSRTIAEKDLGRYGLAGRTKVHFSSVLDKNGKQTVRLRPYGDMASRILGDPQKKNGIDGCEMFSPVLAGEAGVRRRLYMNGIALPVSDKNPPVEGGDIYTTLNIDIQNIVHQSLLDQCKQAKPAWGCAVVMETATGDIKGISNFERKITNGDTSYVETRNYAMVAEVAEPGSTFKLASLLAYLEKTNGDTTHRFKYLCDQFKVGKRTYLKKDKSKYGYDRSDSATVRKIIQKSSNVGVVNMMRYAFPTYAEYVQKLNEMYITVGYSAQIGKLDPVANLRPDTKIFEEQYSRYFGAAFNMQPMQTLVYYNAVANGGKMMQPRFVKSSRVEGKVTEYPTVVIAEQIASKRTIAIAQDILRSVVAGSDGTAYNTARRVAPGLAFSGKTGTRDIYDTQLGAYNKNRNAVSFCGYFPSDKPKYTCIVYLFDAPYPASSANAITVFANIAKRILNPPHELDSAVLTTCFPHPVRTQAANQLNAKYGLKLNSCKGSRYCASDSEDPKRVKSVEVKQSTDKIPNVVGLNASDAVTELRKSGYSIRIEGRGVVKSQSVNHTDKIITLTLSPG